MAERIDYQIGKYSFAEVNATARIARQWAMDALFNKMGKKS